MFRLQKVLVFGLLLLGACSGGHVTMVYEDGRNPEGKSARDMITRLDLAKENPKKLEDLVSILETQRPKDFNWPDFWNEIRKRNAILLGMTDDQQARLLKLGAVSCSEGKAAESLNAFLNLLVESRRLDDSVASLVDKCGLPVNAELVLDIVEQRLNTLSANAKSEEKTARLDWSRSFVKAELAKNDLSWKNLLQSRFGELRATTMLRRLNESAVQKQLADKKGEELSPELADTLEIAQSLNKMGLNTERTQSEVTQPIIGALNKPASRTAAEHAIALIQKQDNSLFSGRDLWKSGANLSSDSKLIKDKSALFSLAADFCSKKGDLKPFDVAGYRTFFSYITQPGQPDIVGTLLDPKLPCLNELPSEIVYKISDIVAAHYFPTSSIMQNMTATKELMTFAEKFMAFASATLLNPRTHGEEELHVFMSSKTRQNLMVRSLALVALGYNKGADTALLKNVALTWARVDKSVLPNSRIDVLYPAYFGLVAKADGAQEAAVAEVIGMALQFAVSDFHTEYASSESENEGKKMSAFAKLGELLTSSPADFDRVFVRKSVLAFMNYAKANTRDDLGLVAFHGGLFFNHFFTNPKIPMGSIFAAKSALESAFNLSLFGEKTSAQRTEKFVESAREILEKVVADPDSQMWNEETSEYINLAAAVAPKGAKITMNDDMAPLAVLLDKIRDANQLPAYKHGATTRPLRVRWLLMARSRFAVNDRYTDEQKKVEERAWSYAFKWVHATMLLEKGGPFEKPKKVSRIVGASAQEQYKELFKQHGVVVVTMEPEDILAFKKAAADAKGNISRDLVVVAQESAAKKQRVLQPYFFDLKSFESLNEVAYELEQESRF